MSALANPADPYYPKRVAMVGEQLRNRGIRDARVLAAMERVPRHLFVPEGKQHEAYEDHPIIIGERQTISQPYIVGAMLQALSIQPQDSVLEVGTGSGYQTALLAELAARVISLERFESLAMHARELLQSLRYSNVTIITGDGSEGYSPAAPYDAIVVAAAAPQVPPALLEQLAEGGRMIVPVGTSEEQQLELIRKIAGTTYRKLLEGCRFVPLIGCGGFNPPA